MRRPSVANYLSASDESTSVRTIGVAPVGRVVALAWAVIAELREKEITFMAAAIAYYALVSLVPLFVLVAVAAVLVGGDPLRAEIVAYVRGTLPAAEGYVETALDDRTAQGGLGAVSVVISLWGGLKVFRGFDVAFARIYGTDPGGLIDQIRDALVALVSLAGGVLVVVVLATALALIESPVLGLASPILLSAALFVALLPLYYVLPGTDASIVEVLPGTAFAAVGFTLLAGLFGTYVALTTGVAGTLGAVLLLVTYFYFAGLVLLAGAAINAVVARPTEDRQVQHA